MQIARRSPDESVGLGYARRDDTAIRLDPNRSGITGVGRPDSEGDSQIGHQTSASAARWAKGQLGEVIRMLEDSRDCADVVTQLAAVSRALDRAGFRLIASGLQQCVTAREGGAAATVDEKRVERLFLSLA